MGPVIARANHDTNVIELNADIYPSMPPYMREYVMCHELVHLEYGEYDEQRTNEIAQRIFLNNAKGEADLEARKDFLRLGTANANQSNLGTVAITSIIGLAMTVFSTGSGLIGQYKSSNPFTSLELADQKKLTRNMIVAAFEQSQLVNDKSAKQIFEGLLANYWSNGYDAFVDKYREWFLPMVAEVARGYDFGWNDITPINLWKYAPFRIAVIVAVAALAVFITAKITKKKSKK